MVTYIRELLNYSNSFGSMNEILIKFSNSDVLLKYLVLELYPMIKKVFRIVPGNFQIKQR